MVIAGEAWETPRHLPRQVEDASKAFLQADRQLVDRCLAGEVAAWEEFYAQCHDPLCTAIRIMLGRPHGDPNLVDEIASRVWYALVANDGKLLGRYSPDLHAQADHVHAGLGKGRDLPPFSHGDPPPPARVLGPPRTIATRRNRFRAIGDRPNRISFDAHAAGASFLL